MPHNIILPEQGDSIESCILVEWKFEIGDQLEIGDTLVEVETAKATFEIATEHSGLLLKTYFSSGDDVPVLSVIASIGAAGEVVPDSEIKSAKPVLKLSAQEESIDKLIDCKAIPPVENGSSEIGQAISPRAKKVASEAGLETSDVIGSGPLGRIIEKDVKALLGNQKTISPVAKHILNQSDVELPVKGSGIGGRVLSVDILDLEKTALKQHSEAGLIRTKPIKGVRKVIAERMLHSLQSSAQLTISSSADARSILSYRKKLKESLGDSDLRGITINDILLYACSRALKREPNMNACFMGDYIVEYENIHLGFAVDTDRGLIVPVIKNAHQMSLKQISYEAGRLIEGARSGTLKKDDLTGGTFTMTNLGVMGIENFTPILNSPEVGILGICNIQPKPIYGDHDVEFIPHIGLSLTFNHCALDGMAAAQFLKSFSETLAHFELSLAK